MRRKALRASLKRNGSHAKRLPKGRKPTTPSEIVRIDALSIFPLQGRKEAAKMNATITVRDVDPRDKSWLKREARHVGVSMEEFVRRLIREKRVETECRPKPSEAFARHFGPEHGVELPTRRRYGYKLAEFADETET